MLTRAWSTSSPKSAASPAVTRCGRREWITRLGLGSAALLALGCAGSTTPQAQAQPPTVRRTPRSQIASASGELTAFVPAAGLEWMVVLDPRECYTQLQPFGVEFLSDRRLDTFAEHTGLELRSCSQAVVAGYVDSTLYVTRVAGGSARFAASFERRYKSRSPAAAATDINLSVSELQHQETFFALDADVCALAIGNPVPAQAARLFARGQLKRSPAALAGSSLQQLPARAHQGQLRIYAPGPLAGNEHALLERVHAASISLDLVDKRLIGRAYAVGDFSAEEDAQLHTFVEQVLRSELASLLTLDSAADTLRHSRDEAARVFECDWDAERVLEATVGVLEARVSAILADPWSTHVSK